MIENRPSALGRVAATCATLALFLALAGAAQASPERWRYAWPQTDFEKYSIDFDEIISGGPVKKQTENDKIVYSVDAEKLSKIMENDENFASVTDGLTKMDSFLN